MWVYDGVGIKVVFFWPPFALREPPIDFVMFVNGRSFAGMVDQAPFEST